jgi:hypothetical protein
MNTRTVLLGALATVIAAPLVQGANIDRATLTEVVNAVSIIEPASKKSASAKVQQLFTAPNILRTGPNSRAEMISPDQTVTRVGQSTLFSFEPNSREIELQRGSILFQSPSGKGGGNIRTPAASAAVLGTTLIVTTTKNGGFKVLLLEGKGRVRTANGTTRILKSGQMVYALPGGKLSQILEFRLSQQVSASRLVGGFKKTLPSTKKIQDAINRQEKDIASGRAVGTNLLASGSPNFAFQIDVARETLVQSTAEAATDPLTTAVTTDAIIDNPVLDETRVFADDRLNGPGPGAITTSNFGDDDYQAMRAARPTSFLANNITFDTPAVTLSGSPGSDLFQFLAINDITFTGSTDFGVLPMGELQLLAGGTITAAPNTVLTADADQFTLLALGDTFPLDGSLPESLADISLQVPLELTDFGMQNTRGNTSIIGGEIRMERVALEAGKTLRVTGAGSIGIRGADGAEPVFDPDFSELPPPNGAATLRGGSEVRVKGLGSVGLQNVAIQAPKIRVTSEKVLKLTAVQLVDGSVPNPSSPPSGAGNGTLVTSAPTESVYLFGKQLADLRRVNFFANDVLIQSNTIRLENVRFRDGSRVLLESSIGRLADNPNTGAPVQPGRVNFVRNVDYGSSPAENAVIQNGPAPTPGGPGIVIRPIRGRPSN